MKKDIEPVSQVEQPIQTAQKPPLRWFVLLPSLILLGFLYYFLFVFIANLLSTLLKSDSGVFYLLLLIFFAVIVCLSFIYLLRWVEQVAINKSSYAWAVVVYALCLNAILYILFFVVSYHVGNTFREDNFISPLDFEGYLNVWILLFEIPIGPVVLYFLVTPFITAKYPNRYAMIHIIAALIPILFLYFVYHVLSNLTILWSTLVLIIGGRKRRKR